MIIVPMMRASALAIVLAAGALVGCSSPCAMMARTNVAMAPVSPAITGPYSGFDWYTALNAEMTSDNGGD